MSGNNANAKTVYTGTGTVKAVPSGDTVIITELNRTVNGPPPEREVQLSGVRAPRVGRTGFAGQPSNEDKPFAWPAREFLRKKCIGKRVTFTIEHSIPDSNRGFGCVFLVGSGAAAPATPENLIEAGVEAGWLEVSTGNGRENRPDVQALLALQAKAEAEKKGRFCGVGGAALKSVRPVYNKLDLYAHYDKMRGQPLKAVVHEIRSGSVVRLVFPDHKFLPLQIQLSGVQSPGYKRDATGEYKPEPFARESKFFLEQAILNRDVIVNFYGIDNKSIYGTVEYAKRDVGLELLKCGLAWYVGWSGAKIPLSEDYKKAQEVAVAAKLRHWSVAAAPTAAPVVTSSHGGNKPLPATFNARVCEIVNGGAVRVEYGGQQHLISFASVRAVQPPRSFGGRRKGNRGSKDTDDNAAAAEIEETEVKEEVKKPVNKARDRQLTNVAREAREWLRSRVIGQKVHVKRDYARVGRTSAPDKIYYTVEHKKENVAVGLVAAGLATVIEHGMSDDRSFAYDELVRAEKKAKKQKVGIHDKPENTPSYRVNDLTTPDAQLSDKARASKRASLRKYFETLNRRGATRGVVEWVINPTKLKVYIPKENVILMVTLAGIRTPRPGDTQQFKDAPLLAERALSAVKQVALQRDCTVTVYQVQDRGGSLLGSVDVGRSDVARSLLERGLAHTAGGRMPRENDYQTSEKHAQLAKKGLWRGYDPEREAKVAAEAKAASTEKARRQEVLEVVVTEIVDGNTLYLQVLGDTSQQLEKMMNSLRQESLPAAPATIKKGDLLAGQFTVDDTWYRCKVEEVDASKDEYFVRYVDYGNSETLPKARLAALPAARYSPTALPFQAQLAKLAFLRAPSLEDDFGTDAARQLRDLAFGRQLVAAVEARRDGNLYVSLGDPTSQVHVNAAMLKAGLSVLKNRRDRCSKVAAPLLKILEEEQGIARKQHTNMWQYGDVGDDDEEDFRR